MTRPQPAADKTAVALAARGIDSLVEPMLHIVSRDTVLELDGVAGPLAAEAFSRAAMKLPIKTKVVARLGDTSHLGGE